MWWRNWSWTVFYKIKIEHNSGSTVGNFIQFVVIVSPSRGLPKYIETKMLTTCSYKAFSKNKKVWN